MHQKHYKKTYFSQGCSHSQYLATQQPFSMSTYRWYRKIATRISNYSLLNAIIYSMARFYSIRRMTRVRRWIRSRLVPSAYTYQPLTDLVSGPSLENTVKNLRTAGWCYGLALNSNVVQELLNYMKNQKYTCPSIPSNISFMLKECEEVEKKYDISICSAKFLAPNDSKIIESITNDKKLYGITTKYFGYPPTKVEVKFLVNFENNIQRAEYLAQEQAVYFHPDVDRFIHSLSFFFYLTPTNEESGAHVLIPGTHRAKKLSQLFRTLNFSDDEIEEAYPNSPPVIICGYPGEGFVEDSYIFHKALSSNSGDRFLMQVRCM